VKRFSRAIQRRVHIDHVLGIPHQRPNYPTRTSELLLKRVASDEIVVQPDPVLPSQLHWATVPRADVIGVEAAGDIESRGVSRHRGFELRQVFGQVFLEYRGQVVSNDGREACFERVDEGRATAETPDPEFLAGPRE